jgi:hypothetical protein
MQDIDINRKLRLLLLERTRRFGEKFCYFKSFCSSNLTVREIIQEINCREHVRNLTWLNLTYYPNIWLEGLKETTKYLR